MLLTQQNARSAKGKRGLSTTTVFALLDHFSIAFSHGGFVNWLLLLSIKAVTWVWDPPVSTDTLTFLEAALFDPHTELLRSCYAGFVDNQVRCGGKENPLNERIPEE
jgi:hypothetical protein